jgi:hypothetical protein
MQQFNIPLKNTKGRSLGKISWIIIIFHIIVFLCFAFFSTNRVVKGTSIAAVSALAVLSLLGYFFLKHAAEWTRHVLFLLILLAWLNLRQYWLALIPVIFDLLDTLIPKKPVVTFSEKQIVYPSFPSKKISWNQLSNALLKDGLLTLDFKNNRISQEDVDQTETTINEEEFNEFCRQQLTANT